MNKGASWSNIFFSAGSISLVGAAVLRYTGETFLSFCLWTYGLSMLIAWRAALHREDKSLKRYNTLLHRMEGLIEDTDHSREMWRKLQYYGEIEFESP